MLKIGDKVKWNDPDIQSYPEEDWEYLKERVFTIDNINGEVITISDNYSEVEVLESELELIKKY